MDHEGRFQKGISSVFLGGASMSVILNQSEINKMKLIGQGAEASVYKNGNRALKIFKGKLRNQKEPKIDYMISRKIDLSNVLYPQEKIVDEKNNFLGYSMPFAECWGSLSDFFNKSIYYMPTFALVRIAINLCQIYDEVNRFGIAIGDGNPKNFLIPSNLSCVYLADADSIQLKGYKCNVGMPDYLSPEIQAALVKNTGNIAHLPDGTFSVENDRFSLSCLVFQIMMNGSHPFSYGKRKANESSLTVVKPSYGILRRESAYFGSNGVLSSDTLNIDKVMTPRLKNVLKRGLLGQPHERPSARELKNELVTYLNSLEKSSCGKQHSVRGVYRDKCPYCELARKKEAIQKKSNDNLTSIKSSSSNNKPKMGQSTLSNNKSPITTSGPKKNAQMKNNNTIVANSKPNSNGSRNMVSGNNKNVHKYVEPENDSSVLWGVLAFVIIAICEIAFFVGTSATDGTGIAILVCCLIFDAISCIYASATGRLSGVGVFLLLLINAIGVPILGLLVALFIVGVQLLFAIIIVAIILGIVCEF